MLLNQKYSAISESATLAITKQVRELKAIGKDVIGLTLGEPDFDTPEHIKEAAVQALRDGYTHYPPVAGLPELREAIVEKFRRENQLDYQVANILVSTGAKQSVFNVVNALINQGDEAVLPAPYWVSYRDILQIAGAEVREVEASVAQNYKLSAEQLEAAITPKTKLIMYSSPCNPTGSMYTREELAAWVEVLKRHPQVYVISDEIYEHLAYDQTHVSIASFEEIKDRVIIINGFAKGYAMTGWRLGYMAAPTPIVQLCEKIQGQVTSGANSFAQKAAVTALSGTMEPTYAMREAFRLRRDTLFPLLKGIEGMETSFPSGAFYFYPDVHLFIGKSTPDNRKITDILGLCSYLVDRGVALIPGDAFGTQHHLRISYAYEWDTIRMATERIKEALADLR